MMQRTTVLLLLATIFASCNAPNAEQATPQEPAPSTATTSEPTKECGPVQAYAISKGILQQALRPDVKVVIPSYEAGFVSVTGTTYAIDAFFYREDAKVPFTVSLTCQNENWEVSSASVNGAPAYKGAGL